MEMTATAQEVSKSDFFDFVTSNEITDAQYKEQMRSVNVFMESPESRSNPLLSEEPKEQNNNVLTVNNSMATTSSVTTTLQSFDSIWNVDRERDRLETAMLEDLNKYYWNQENDIAGSQPCETVANTSNKLISNNTDGQIYTLTVLNQEPPEPNTNRYWCKEEDVSMSSPTEIEQQSSLDLETILNIMPNQINGFPNEFGQDALSTSVVVKSESYPFEENEIETVSNEPGPQTIKIEQFPYDETEFVAKDDTVIETPLLERQIEFNNNNNDWKLTDQNAESNESLLRSALQGKALLRYNAVQKNAISKLESGEIKRIIINENNNKIELPSLYRDHKTSTPELMMLNPQNGNVNIVLFEDPATSVVSEAENSTSAQSVDDILLSQLDTSYPDDYEKLKRIASELGESVQQYCTVEPADRNRNVYNIHHVNGELVTMIPAGEVQIPQTHLQIVATSPTVSSTRNLGHNKKYKRVQSKSSPTNMTQSGTAVQPATSTSNGVRKERSLHYCSICSKGFKDKYSVNVHVRTHTGEKPFSCSLCGKSFRQKAHLAKHYQTHIAQKGPTTNGAVKNNKQR